MSTRRISPSLAGRLCSLAESQLQTQAARSASLDAAAFGVMSACAAVAAIVLAIKSAEHLWVVALVLLGGSAGLAVRTLLLAGARRNGPSIAKVLEARLRNDDELVEEGLLRDLAAQTFANDQALARKEPLISPALALLVLAVLLELTGVH